WSRAADRTMAEILLDQAAIDTDQRALLEGLVGQHLKKFVDPQRSLAALEVGASTRQTLDRLDVPGLEGSLAHVGPAPAGGGTATDPDRTPTFALGTAAAVGQRFRVLRPHARGGLGAVFVALDEELHREVALKQILDRHADDPISRARFRLEAEVTGRLEHPGIVPVYGLGTSGD